MTYRSVTTPGQAPSSWASHLVYRRLVLIVEMAKRSYKLRFAGSYLGVVWSVLGPLLGALITATIFSFLLGGQMAGSYSHIPYGVFYFAGFGIWGLFSEVISRSTTIVLENAPLITKISFPVSILPVVVLVSSLVNYGVFLAIAAALMAYSGTAISHHLYLLPLYFVLGAVLTTGISYFVAAVGVFVRDLAPAVPIVLNVLFFMAPITYSPDVLRRGAPPWAQKILLDWNPMSHLVEGYRTSLIDTGSTIDFNGILMLSVVSFAILGSGLICFRALKPGFADVL